MMTQRRSSVLHRRRRPRDKATSDDVAVAKRERRYNDNDDKVRQRRSSVLHRRRMPRDEARSDDVAVARPEQRYNDDDDKARHLGTKGHLHILRNERNQVARHDRAAGIFFPVQVYKTHCRDGLEAGRRVSLMVLIPTYGSEMSGVLSKLLDEQFLPLVP